MQQVAQGRKYEEPRLYSLGEAAELLGRSSIWTIRRQAALGRVKTTKIGKRIFVSSDELARIIAEGLPSLPGPKKANAETARA